jgi:choline dehydrogenase-like flavoprotein
MIIDARSLSNNTKLEADVCIVGGGVAGMAVAREFIGQPFRVCLLESGGLEPDSDTQALCRGENVGHPYFKLDEARPRCLGGSSYNWFMPIDANHVGIQLRPLDPIDFEERDWVPHSGWPFGRKHLDPFYKRAQTFCELGPFQYRGEDWADPETRPCLPFVNGRVQTVVFQLGSRDTFIARHRTEITRSENITTYLHATAAEIETDAAAQSVSRLRIACGAGRAASVTAKVFILALGGIETPRLLLLSSRTQSDGLGNGNGLVGRYFMEHLHLLSGTYVSSKQDAERLERLYTFHAVGNTLLYARLALSEETLRREKLLSYSVAIPRAFWPLTVRAAAHKLLSTGRLLGASLRKGELREGRRHLDDMISLAFNDAAPAVGRKMAGLAKKKFLDKFVRLKKVELFMLNHMTEQAPNPDSRVTLSDELDALGQRRVKLDWRLTPADIRSIVRAQRILDEELKRAGLGHLEIDLKNDAIPPDVFGGWHHMGTTRMHRDPRKGVVNEDSRVHGIHNLFVAGPSVFPTGGYANPTLTIAALSIRLADHVKARMKESPRLSPAAAHDAAHRG